MGAERREWPDRAEAWNVLGSKLRAPRLHEDTVPRWRVLDRLRASGEATCVVVRAPAGYGKTTAVRQWAATDGRPVARGSASTAATTTRWCCCATWCGPSTCSSRCPGRRRGPGDPTPSRGRRPPRARLGAGPPHRALRVGARRRARGPARRSVAVLERLIDLVPVSSQLVLIGRGMPQLHVTRRLLSGQAAEVVQAELAFSEAEARAMLAVTLPGLDELSVKRLLEQTEGWPAGLHLAALALHGHPDPEVVIDGLATADRRLTEYFRDEFLHHLPTEDSSFLLRSALLDRMTPELCDAALATNDSAAVLQRLASSGNLFVVSLEQVPPAFRYHHLFAELLVAELRRTDPSAEAEVRRRAAVWYSEHGDSEGAVAQATATGDGGFAAEMVFRQVAGTIHHGTLDSLDRWLSAFGPATAPAGSPARPRLGLAGAHACADVAGVHHWLGVLEGLTYDGSLPDGTADVAVAVAALRMTSGAGGVRATAASARVVLAAGPSASPWWGLAVLLEANAAWAMGDIDDPIQAFVNAAVSATKLSAGPHRGAGLRSPVPAADRRRGARPGHRPQRPPPSSARADLEGYILVGIVHCVRAYAAARRGPRPRHAPPGARRTDAGQRDGRHHPARHPDPAHRAG